MSFSVDTGYFSAPVCTKLKHLDVTSGQHLLANLLLCKRKFTDTLAGFDFAPVPYLVGGFNPFEKYYESTWIIFPK